MPISRIKWFSKLIFVEKFGLNFCEMIETIITPRPTDKNLKRIVCILEDNIKYFPDKICKL